MNAKVRKAVADLRSMGVTMYRNTGPSAAETCRANGWGIGTVLEGDEGHGPTQIVLTAIGEDSILARPISHNGKPSRGREGLWTLALRDWKRVDPLGATDTSGTEGKP